MCIRDSGYTGQFTIYDDDDSRRMVREIMIHLGIEDVYKRQGFLPCCEYIDTAIVARERRRDVVASAVSYVRNTNRCV